MFDTNEVHFRGARDTAALFIALLLLACALAPEAFGAGEQVALEPQSVAAQARHLITDHVLLVITTAVLAAAGGMLFGFYRLPFFSHRHPQWRMIFRLEVVAVASVFSAILFYVRLEPESWAELAAMVCLAVINGLATPLAYDFVWRPALWPLITKLWHVVTEVIIAGVRDWLARIFTKPPPPS